MAYQKPSSEVRKPIIDPSKAQSALKKVSLASVILGDYMVILRSELDTFIRDEPYIPIMILLNVRSGRYLTRVWGQTINEGLVARVNEFTEVCRSHFSHGRACIGCPDSDNTLVPSRFSNKCQRFLGKDADIGEKTCQECLKLMEDDDDSEIKCKVENLDLAETVSQIIEDDDAPLKKRRKIGESNSVKPESQNATLDTDLYDSGDFEESNYFESDSLKEDNAKDTDGIQDADFGIDDYDEGSEYSGSEDILNEEVKTCKRKTRARTRAKTSTDDDPDFTMPATKTPRLVDSDDEPLECPDCSETFVSRASLSSHRRKNHLPDHKTKCPWCTSVMGKDSVNLVMHKIRKHFWGEFRSVRFV